jgi:hypothetical protein
VVMTQKAEQAAQRIDIPDSAPPPGSTAAEPASGSAP